VIVTGLGALAVVVAQFLHYGSGSAWSLRPTRFPLGMTLLALAVFALVVAGIRLQRPLAFRIAVGVAVVLVAQAFPLTLPLSYTAHPGELGTGFWLGVAGALVAFAGALWAARGARQAAAEPRPARLSVPGPSIAGIPVVAVVGPVIVIVSTFLRYAELESAWKLLPTRYALGITVLSLLSVGLVYAGLRSGRRVALWGAAAVALFVLGEAFPLWYYTYSVLKGGFSVGVVGAAIGAVVTIGIAALAKRVPGDPADGGLTGATAGSAGAVVAGD
jgi:hypothetical protein